MSSWKYILGLFLILILTGCSNAVQGNTGRMETYKAVVDEPQWIRDGEPIEFEENFWYPEDRYDVLLDSEVYLIGTYRDTQFFVEKVDVRPFNRLYTKFGRNKFRSYYRRASDD